MSADIVPGEVIPGDGPVELFADAALVAVTVTNTGDRAVQVGSHYHFAEANPALSFDRSLARGHRLAIPAGTSVRFEPGIDRRVELVPLGGRRVVAGLRGEVAGPLDADPSPHTDFLRGSGRWSDQNRAENPGEPGANPDGQDGSHGPQGPAAGTEA